MLCGPAQRSVAEILIIEPKTPHDPPVLGPELFAFKVWMGYEKIENLLSGESVSQTACGDLFLGVLLSPNATESTE